jgi:hypothetical protein
VLTCYSGSHESPIDNASMLCAELGESGPSVQLIIHRTLTFYSSTVGALNATMQEQHVGIKFDSNFDFHSND